MEPFLMLLVLVEAVLYSFCGWKVAKYRLVPRDHPRRDIIPRKALLAFWVAFLLDCATSAWMAVEGASQRDRLSLHAAAGIAAFAAMAASAGVAAFVPRKGAARRLFSRGFPIAWLIWMGALAVGLARA